MKISGSILAAKEDYFTYAKSLLYANVDYLHIDIFDGKNKFNLSDILAFDNSYLPLDLHLIYHKITSKDMGILNRANAYYCNIQFETLEDKSCINQLSKEFKGNFGIAITEKTPLSAVDPYIDSIAQILIMCSEPGISGAKFAESNFERIKKLKAKYPNLPVFADGGINEVIAEKMNQLGVDLVVSGSYLSADIALLPNKAYQLRYANEQHVMVTRKMIKPSLLPVIDEKVEFFSIMDTMNHYRLGCVFVTAGNQELTGIISDGDIRRAFIKYGRNIFDVRAAEIVNRTPFTVGENEEMEAVYEKLSSMHKGIDVVPIVQAGKFIGALDLHIGL